MNLLPFFVLTNVARTDVLVEVFREMENAQTVDAPLPKDQHGFRTRSCNSQIRISKKCTWSRAKHGGKAFERPIKSIFVFESMQQVCNNDGLPTRRNRGEGSQLETDAIGAESWVKQ